MVMVSVHVYSKKLKDLKLPIQGWGFVHDGMIIG